jgi:hypothetical protein
MIQPNVLATLHNSLVASRKVIEKTRNILIRSWNIDGDLPIKLTYPKIISSIRAHHINLFQETHLHPDQHNSLCIPLGHTCFANSRPPKLSLGMPWGGVLALVSSDLQLEFRCDLSGADFMVIALKDCLIYNVYMLPKQSNWQKWSETHPCNQLLQSLMKTSSLDVPFLIPIYPR